MTQYDNPMGTDGFKFLEFASPHPDKLAADFKKLGFRLIGQHKTKAIDLYRQGEINFLLNHEPNGHARNFAEKHGPCVSAMGFKLHDPKIAYERALSLDAKPYTEAEGNKGLEVPAIYGIGDNLLYFVGSEEDIYRAEFNLTDDTQHADEGLLVLDHVTHNVFQGRLDYWAEFYIRLFNFHEIRYFDIRGKKTGLLSRAMGSPCGKIGIPLNEATEETSQIAEFLRAFNGEGIQHFALTSDDIYSSIESLKERDIRFLETPDTYYRQINDRVPGHVEDIARLARNKILIDGNGDTDEGILLQIFTENMVGPAFYEIIQRKGNQGFGEGNFTALFKAIELDQIERGVL